MDATICYIKSEYVISDSNASAEPTDTKPETTDSSMKRLSSENADANNERKKKKFDRKESRKRGQNKNRPVFKEDRHSYLCNSLINGPNGESCSFPNCRYVHDLDAYLESKPKDIAEICQIYTTKGFCNRGLTCRFASAHIDENRKNLKADFYDEKAPPTTVNGIKTELQMKLRKREYDFSKIKKIIQEYDATKKSSDKKHEKDDSQSDVAKEIGCVVDDDDLTKKKVDFVNKLILSPLTTVGNLPFRRICKEFGADITCGEMACSVPLVKGLNQEWALTKRHVSEDVFGVQICGMSPQVNGQVVQLLQENSMVDFVDLNVGCPIDLIYQQGAGSALMRRANVLEAIVKCCSTLLGTTPFTVKMRTGIYADKSVAHELITKVEDWGAGAVTIHGRSREQRYTKSANWEYIEECASKVKRIPVIGNGDVLSYEDYIEKKKIAPHVSSIMIGRGALLKPWIFKEIKEQKAWDPTSSERFEILKKFTNYGLEHWGSDTKGVENTRRFLLEWQSFLYRYVPYGLVVNPPQKINQRPEKFRGRDEMETLLSSPSSSDWIKISEMLLGPVPEGFTFLPKHKANAY